MGEYADKWVNDVPEEHLSQVAQVPHQIQEPEEIRYLETERTMSKCGKIRAIVIQSGENKQRSANHEKKRFLDAIKVFVCNLRAEMGRMLLKHYGWKRDVWPAVSVIVERGGLVKLEQGDCWSL